jgi:ubiquinone/menaquinone biosynthesis C-methylase UbiE
MDSSERGKVRQDSVSGARFPETGRGALRQGKPPLAVTVSSGPTGTLHGLDLWWETIRVSLPSAADNIAYLTGLAASAHGRLFRERALAALDLRPGQVALDVGCGPGANLEDLSAAVTAAGRVIGVDMDPAMVGEAKRRMAGRAMVEVLLGDAHAIPVADGSVDRVQVDRVLQHVAAPGEVLAEVRRVARSGAILTLGEPDWATLAIDAGDLRTSVDFTAFICSDVIRNPSIGRELVRLATAAGFVVRSAEALAPLFRDFGDADRIIGLTQHVAWAVASRSIEQDRATRWLASLRRPPFLATVTFFIVVAEAVA